MRFFVAVTGVIMLILAEILCVYFIMPFPGSQRMESIDFAYWIGKNMLIIRILLLALVSYPVITIFRRGGKFHRILLAILLLLYGVVFYFFNFRFMADTMFYQPKEIRFSNAKQNKVSRDKLILGVEINGVSKAYPIQLIGYHHQVRDTVGGVPVMVTYCTVCRTGRVFSPFINGKNEDFRLVGMDHFNAMFEDATTKSWWRQVSGEAVAGPMKGEVLNEIPSTQMRLSSWFRLHPDAVVLQPDTTYKAEYSELEKFDLGTLKSSLEKRDSLSWKDKSWVVGIRVGKFTKAIDWNRLVAERVIQDSLSDTYFVLMLEDDLASFHAYNRKVDGRILRFRSKTLANGIVLVDDQTGSEWNIDGHCISGPMQGKVLENVSAYQEFWHSWKTFNPLTAN